MINVFQSIKTKLQAIVVIIIALFVVSYVMVYNSRYYAKDIVKLSSQLKNLQLYPEQMQVQFKSFIHKEVISPEVFIKEKSSVLDSIERIVNYQIKLLDTLRNISYLQESFSETRVNALRYDLQKFNAGNKEMFQALLVRGFNQSGKAGEWYRQGELIENYIGSLKNPALLKAWIDIRKNEFRYNLEHSEMQIDKLTDDAVALKAKVMAGDGLITSGIANPDRLRIMAEIDKYIEVVVSVRNNDKVLGFGTNEGIFGNQISMLNTIKLKSQSISSNVEEQIDEYTQNQFLLRVLALLLLTGFVVALISLSYKGVLRSIYSLKKYLQELVLGKLPEPLSLKTSDELDSVSELLSDFVKSIREKVKFAQSLGAGKETHNLVPLSNDDSLANALLDLQISLQKASEEDNKYKIDEKKRAWANEGLAKFSEILRFQTSNITELSDLIIKNLVKYLDANQGGVFAYVDDIPEDAHLDLVSAFAFDRKKYISKRINIGEGLVGTCAQERQTIFMTDIPDGYLSITSGLGESKPRSLLIVPLKTEENIYGIIEIASFNVFESHELEFVEKLAQSIASTFASLKINVHTAQLLEQSKKQAEEMAQQEEEMRQNLEELQATQEESARKEAEIVSVLSAIQNSSMVMELDMEGKIIEVNSKYCSNIKCFHEDMIGKNLRSICFFDPQSDDYNNFWVELRNGRSLVREEEIHFNNKTYYFTQYYSPIFDQERKPYKILVIASNNTENINLEENATLLRQKLTIKDQEISGLFEVLDKAIILAELTPDGTIEKANKNYLEITGYLEKEVIGKNARFFLKPEELKQFDLIWAEVEKGKEHKGVVRRTKPTGEEYWLMSAAIPVIDNRGQVTKIYFIAQDITEKKLKYQVLEEANKEIERLRALYESNNTNNKE